MSARVALGTCALGRALDACGRPLDGGPPPRGRRIDPQPRVPAPAQRAAIEAPAWCGVRAIDGLLTFGRGARIGLFGAPGAGKSTLLEAIVRGTCADAVVVALAGERGREARAWIDRVDARTTLFCATGDRPPQERAGCARIAFAHAGALRERGLHVLLVLDSLARVAAALRELAVEAGESTGRGGYPPSVFARLAQLVELAGPVGAGSVTLVATVLDDGDDRDPVSDAARSLLDGHIALSPRLAGAGCFPAIDVTASASRTMAGIVAEPHRRAAATVRRAIWALERTEEARSLGIAVTDPATAQAVASEAAIERFLRQAAQPSVPAQTLAMLHELADTLEEPHGYQ